MATFGQNQAKFLCTAKLDKFIPHRDCMIRMTDLNGVPAYLLGLWKEVLLREKHMTAALSAGLHFHTKKNTVHK